ncbi:MAG TPA: hypothetical protein VNR11_08585 [Xanthobacteraceae bacterium]|nr:hypothetical protein [Xanthobacteraceae bacterium]
MSPHPHPGPPTAAEERGRVVPFRPRAARKAEAFANLTGDPAVPDVDDYQRRRQEPDDYGHRMKMNALALVVLVVLGVGGAWIVETMAQMRRDQDCVLMGRRNCAQLALPAAAPSAGYSALAR